MKFKTWIVFKTFFPYFSKILTQCIERDLQCDKNKYEDFLKQYNKYVIPYNAEIRCIGVKFS